MTLITRQLLFVCGMSCNVVSLGLVYGFPAVLIPYLKDPNSDLTADLDTLSWFVAIPGVLGLVMNILIGPLTYTCGRKWTNLIIISSGLIGWIISAASHSITPLLVARALHGILKGGNYFFGICIGEYSAPEMRGVVGTILRTFISVSVLFGHCVGMFLHWRYLTYVGAGASLLGLLCNLLWTESPDWLIMKRRYQDAEETFYKLRKKTPHSDTEIKNMIRKRQLQSAKSDRNVLQSLRSKPFWRVAAIVLSKEVMSECAGKHFFPAFMIEFITDVTGGSHVAIYVILLDVFSVLGSMVSSLLIKRYSRRGLLLNTSYVAVLFMLSFSLALFLFDIYPSAGYLHAVALLFFILYFMTMYGVTFAAISVLVSELWPSEIRHMGIVYQSLVSSATFTVWMKLVPYLKLYLHVYGMFTVSAVLVSGCILYLYKYLPETKDKTLHEIGEYFQGDSVNSRKPCDGDVERRLLERGDVTRTTEIILKNV